MSELDRAREEAQARRGEDGQGDESDALIDALAAVDPLVVESLIHQYHDRLSEIIMQETMVYDQPFRQYFVEGQRDVALAFRDIVNAAKRGELQRTHEETIL